MNSVAFRSKSISRIASVIQQGDTIEAFVPYNKGFFISHLEVRSVNPWGVYAVIRGKHSEKLARTFSEEHFNIIIKRQFKIKWVNIKEIEFV